MVLDRNNSLDDQLISAIAAGDINQLIHFLDEGIDIDAKYHGSGLLYYAIYYDKLNVLELLLNRDANVNVQDDYGRTPLHHAAYTGRGVELILGKSPNIEAKDKNGWTPLHYAAWQGKLDAARLLVDKNANIGAKTNYGGTPLGVANYYHKSEVAGLLSRKQSEYDNGLFAALESGNLSEVTSFLSRGADFDARDVFGNTLLHRAAEMGHLGIVKYLMERGARLDARNVAGDFPLHRAAEMGHLDILKYFVEKGAKVYVRANCGSTPLHKAARESRLGVIKYLVEERGIDPNVRDDFGNTPLHKAARESRLGVIKYLVEERGVDPNIRDDFGDTPLHEAVGFVILRKAQIDNRLDVIKYLVDEKGVDPEIRNNVGDTPLHRAAGVFFSKSEIPGRLNILKYFIEEKGVDPNVENYSGLTPLNFAEERNNSHVIEYLMKVGTDPNVRRTGSITSTEATPSPSYLDTVKHFMEEEANPKSTDSITLTKTTPSPSYLDTVKHHVEEGAGINVEEKSHISVVEFSEESQQKLLLDAFEQKDLNKIQTLMDNGMGVNARNDNGESLLDLAYDSRDEDFASKVMKLLISKGTYVGGNANDEPFEFSVIDSDKHLLNRVIKDGGYTQYTQNRHIQSLHSSVLQSDGAPGISKLSSKLTNAVDMVRLVQGTYECAKKSV